MTDDIRCLIRPGLRGIEAQIAHLGLPLPSESDLTAALDAGVSAYLEHEPGHREKAVMAAMRRSIGFPFENDG